MAPSDNTVGSGIGSNRPNVGRVSQVANESSSGITGTLSPNYLTSAGSAPKATVTKGSAANSLSMHSETGSNPPSIREPAPSNASATTNPTGPQQHPAHSPEHFDVGHNSGAPVSASAEAIAAAATPAHTSSVAPLSAPLADATAPTTPTLERAHTVTTPTLESTQPAGVPAEFPQHVVAASPSPALPVTPMGVGPVATPSSPPGSLLAYGADLRPPVTAGAQLPPVPPSAIPGSAPVNPTSGSAPAGQPAAVRQQPTNPTTTPTGLTERAFTATVAGAAAGAVAADAATQDRLQRLLDSVARQQPQLHWAIGDLDDGTTVLATDLSSGWIPPHIEIPAGIRLLRPAHRRGDLASLIGPATHTAFYQPGQHLATANGARPVAMSLRPRDTTAVHDLGWELSQATKWRDGLPRLAHTLARAVSARTGLLDSEVGLLLDHLTTVARTVITRYPQDVDPAQVGNWQLLATMNALIRDEKTLANYHFAWFQAHALTGETHR